MHRRKFLTLPLALAARAFAAPRPRVALTIDDFAWRPVAEQFPGAWIDSLLAPTSKRRVQAAAFLTGSNIDNAEGRELVKKWQSAGHLLGNHTYSHRPYHRETFEAFSSDAMKNDALLKSMSVKPEFFRFPGLREGETKEKRDALRAFLKQGGYANGHVTIDTSDWYIDQRLRAALKKDPKTRLDKYRTFYVAHMLDRAKFYAALANTLNVSAPHTLLLHYNVLNALFLDDLMTAFEQRIGFRWIDASEAFADPFFGTIPDVLPAGESLLYALAKQKGVLPKGTPYPAEDGEYLKVAMDQLGL